MRTAILGDVTLTLKARGGEYMVQCDGKVLMTSRLHGSEETLARVACARLPPVPKVLIGGLGLGYTTRAALDLLPQTGAVTISELVPDIVMWNRELLGHLCRQPLADPRVRVEAGDIRALLERTPETWDAIMLDVDNGPVAVTRPGNADLYGVRGIELMRSALRDGGALAVWSAGPDERYAKRLREAGFQVDVQLVRAGAHGRGQHVIFTARLRAG